MVGLRRAREFVEDSAAKVSAVAEDTRASLVAVAVVAVVALLVSLVAVVVNVRRARAV